ncbi:MAG: hypothetical protein IH818_13810 [Acidobacteria bacterium]|nr:hypothetical protein [Acidobacteriota bacterium]
MSDLGTDIRRYYESVVERVDPTAPPIGVPPRSGYSMRTGLALAVLVAVVVLVVFGLAPLLLDSTPPVDSPDPVAPPSTSIDTTVATTTPQAIPLGPSVFVTSDGVEIGSITEDGPVFSNREMETMFGYVLRELTSNRDYWPSLTDPGEALGLYPDSPPTGLIVELTINWTAQEIVESVIAEWHDDPETFISVVVVDNGTGRIIAAGPGASHISDTFEPERLLPAASLAQVYTTVAALEAGFPLISEWDASSPQTFTSPDWEGEWTVHNAGSSKPPTSLHAALYAAVNTVFAGVGMEIGADAIIDTATRLGVNLTGLDALSPNSDSGLAPPEAVAIGAGEITTFDAAAMFAALSRDGVHTPPIIIESITAANGEIIYQAPERANVTIDLDIVEEVRKPLADVTRIGTGARALSGFNQGLNPIGKTGTADNYLAAWYAGSTDLYTIAVGVGRLGPGNQLIPLEHLEFNGETYMRVFGGSVPAPIWVEIMTELHDTP